MGTAASLVSARQTRALYKVQALADDAGALDGDVEAQKRVIQKFRYRLRELAKKTLKTEHRRRIVSELAAAEKYERHLDPSHQQVQVHVWRKVPTTTLIGSSPRIAVQRWWSKRAQADGGALMLRTTALTKTQEK